LVKFALSTEGYLFKTIVQGDPLNSISWIV